MTAFFYWDVISWALSLMLSDRYVNNDGFFVLNLYLNIIHWSFSSMIGRHSVTPNFSIFFLLTEIDLIRTGFFSSDAQRSTIF